MKTILLLLLTSVPAYSALFAQAGYPDPTFGDDGYVTTTIHAYRNEATSVLVQPDGRIIAGGIVNDDQSMQFGLVRYHPDGSIDSSFDMDGIVRMSIGSVYDILTCMALQPDGKIIAAGSSSSGSYEHFTLLRLNADGTPDHSFGFAGVVSTDITGGNDHLSSIALLPDGKIVVAGTANASSSNSNFVVARYNPDGTLDNTFSQDGYVITNAGAVHDELNGMAIQPDGKIVVAGTSRNFPPAYRQLTLIRYTTAGVPDASFDGDGIVTADDNGNSSAKGLALLPDGKILVLGTYNDGSSGSTELRRYNYNGSPDVSFGTNGRAEQQIGETEYTESILLQPDGKILLAGYHTGAGAGGYAIHLLRYTDAGAPDSDFGTGGVTMLDIGSMTDEVHSITLQPDNSIVVAGTAERSTGTDFLVARFLSGLTLGVENTSPVEELSLYPNPVVETATLTYRLESEEKMTVSLLDAQGRTLSVFLQEHPVPAGAQRQLLSFSPEMAPGVYFVQVTCGNRTACIKLLKD